MGGSDLRNPYAKPGRPLYNYDKHVDETSKKIIHLQQNLVRRSSLPIADKDAIVDKIDTLEDELRHGINSQGVIDAASALGDAIAKHAGGAHDAYAIALQKSGRALKACFKTAGTAYNFHETVGPQQAAFFVSLRQDFGAMRMTALTRLPLSSRHAPKIQGANAVLFGAHVSTSAKKHLSNLQGVRMQASPLNRQALHLAALVCFNDYNAGQALPVMMIPLR